ncbi:hypothetical protein PDIP_65460 [Penicillium digitatum Pd1]|uniref:Uncharacterized protein n=1 Tax=Penicillium digitatum (strain Pd1 / CECT 20795) TaxID=1170230 RepID=K9FLK1_PEND1|nr:hypothetical protein PDIP_65460 [Penicillium digitatum Pd1]EKV09162.1 hypothetical protein PDIP_65460 [Penicillium digitatum Pd1]
MRYLFDEGGSSQPPLVFERKECPFFALQRSSSARAELGDAYHLGFLDHSSRESSIILTWKQSRQDDCIPRLAERLLLGKGIAHTSRDGRRWMKRKKSMICQSLLFGWCAGRVEARCSPYRKCHVVMISADWPCKASLSSTTVYPIKIHHLHSGGTSL